MERRHIQFEGCRTLIWFSKSDMSVDKEIVKPIEI